jgi:hypothetical protein
VAGAGRALTPCLLGEGRPEPRSLLKAVWSSLVESPIMAHNGDGGPLRDEPMKVASKSFLRGERLAADTVGDELKAPKSNGFTKGEATAHQTFTVGGDGKHR